MVRHATTVTRRMPAHAATVTRRMPAHAARFVFLVGCAMSLVACGGDAVAETCEQTLLLDNARARVERAVTSLAQSSQVEIEEASLDIVDRLALMRDVAPRELRPALGVLLAAYGQLSVSLGNIGWDTSLAATDAAVVTARAAFTDTSVAGALSTIADWTLEQCGRTPQAVSAEFAASGTTLPMPEVSEEPSRDVDEANLVTDGELTAIGFTIGETYGVALTATEALCVARTLAQSPEASSAQSSDDEYFAVIVDTFTACAVATPPTTAPVATPSG